jgi:hypothetical protein
LVLADLVLDSEDLDAGFFGEVPDFEGAETVDTGAEKSVL